MIDPTVELELNVMVDHHFESLGGVLTITLDFGWCMSVINEAA
jgi:hypothetical protein